LPFIFFKKKALLKICSNFMILVQKKPNYFSSSKITFRSLKGSFER